MHGTNLRLASDSQTSPFFDPAAPHARQPKRARNPDREGALLVRSSLWCFACFLLAGRSRIPARREGVLEANGIFTLDWGRLWASGTVRRLPDEDAIPTIAGPAAAWQLPDESQVIYGTGH